MAADSFRLFVVTDWDAGFQLTPDAKLDDVPPSGEYVTECAPTSGGILEGVVVRDFVLDRLYVGKTFASLKAERGLPSTGSVDDRLYYLEPALPVAVGDSIRAVLKNVSDGPKKPKVAVIVRSDQKVGTTVAPGWRVEGVHVGKAEKALTLSCPTCDSPDRSYRRQVWSLDGANPYCQNTWHDTTAKESAVHAPKISRTLHDGPGNATLVSGCSCGAEATTIKAFADHIGVPERAVDAMLGLVGVIYDLCDYPGKVTREEAARRVARCLEFTR